MRCCLCRSWAPCFLWLRAGRHRCSPGLRCPLMAHSLSAALLWGLVWWLMQQGAQDLSYPVSPSRTADQHADAIAIGERAAWGDCWSQSLSFRLCTPPAPPWQYHSRVWHVWHPQRQQSCQLTGLSSCVLPWLLYWGMHSPDSALRPGGEGGGVQHRLLCHQAPDLNPKA